MDTSARSTGRVGAAACGLAVVLLAGATGCATAPPSADMFVTRSSSKSPEQLHQALRAYVSQKGWLYINDNKIKAGEITQVRICDAKAAANIWQAGLQVSAMMPCGHLSIYSEGGTTKLTLLHPQFLTRVYPHPAVRDLADAVTGPYLAMLDEVTR